ncbi:hypothetical protein E2C01_032696 [Portunus trituberculatus]|uniref:Uncharacterized protein n=1 Tax=Portunus trituberculatus TaxID=210409 RepID=A0A5B7EWL6_PORTR|nr:hypothetical protein [Portunus trituberculatus]
MATPRQKLVVHAGNYPNSGLASAESEEGEIRPSAASIFAEKVARPQDVSLPTRQSQDELQKKVSDFC